MKTRIVLSLALALSLPAGAQAQQRVERFPEPAAQLAAAPLALDDTTHGSYWMEGMVVGVAAGVIGGLLWIDDGGTCTLGVPASCSNDPTKFIGTALTSIATGFLGIIIGSTIEKDRDMAPE